MTARNIDLQKQLAQLKREVPTRGLERHPSLLQDVSDLPTELRSPALVSMVENEATRTIIAFPPQIHRGWHYVPKQALLFTPTDVIHLQASIWPDQEPRITRLQRSGLLYMKASLLLLYGFLEIVARGPNSPTRIGIEFNTVAWYGLSRPLRRFLLGSKPAPDESTDESSYSPAAQQVLERLPLKFSNGVEIHGLLPGEALEDLVFQPGTWRRWLLLFRRPVSPNTLLLLTSNYVVVIEEELGVNQGWIISYIPRSSVSTIQSRPHGLWSALTIQLDRGGQTAEYELLLQDQAVQTWRARWIQHGGRWQDLSDENA